MNELILIIGAKASGKTVEIKDKLSNITDKNAVVFDYCQEYEDFDIIQPDEVVSFLNGKDGKVARIIPVVNGEKMTLTESQKVVLNILDNIKDGILVLEDLTIYAPSSHEIYEKIITLSENTNNNASIICSFQSVSSTHGEFINKAALISLHRQITSRIDIYKSKIESFELFKIAFLLVQNKTKDNKYFFCEISAGIITGDFSKEDYRSACLDYIIEENGLHRYSEHY